METINIEHPINLKVVRFEFDFSTLLQDPPASSKGKTKEAGTPEITKHLVGSSRKKASPVPHPPPVKCARKNKTPKQLVEELLDEIYSDQRDWSSANSTDCGHVHLSRSSTGASPFSRRSSIHDHFYTEREYLQSVDIPELRAHLARQKERLRETGDKLSRKLRARDRLRRQQNKLCAAFTILLRHITGEHGARFGLSPGGTTSDGLGAGEGGFSEWLHAMRLVARLPAGVPQHFRRKLWLTLADRHLSARGVDWPTAERACFRGTALPEDTELGSQILKDLHRTGCSLFCGKEGRENQAMLRRVLLAYARWNKDVGYCQGFNMLAAIILEVMDKSEPDSLKVMIYLVEAVLPEGYFADDLRGLSADMAAFRDLLRLRIPKLAQHMDHLQKMSDGGGVEPPLPDVFTMQWFLTLYATWLQRESLLRIWDLILLDGNEILLLTALAIWDMLQDCILSARSADEYYSCMVGGASSVWEAGEALVVRVVALGSAPELPRLRNLHRYRVTPPAPTHPIGPPNYHPPVHSAMQTMTKKGLRLFYSEDEGDSSDDGNKMALATVAPRRDERLVAGDRLSLDIGALKRQYARLRERQRQAHVILAAACARHAAVGVPTSPTSLTVNNLLLGKSAIVSNRGRRLGPPVGAIPPSRHSPKKDKSDHKRQTDTISWSEEHNKKILSRRNSMKWKDIKKIKDIAQGRKPSIDMDETGDGVIVSEQEANRMIASVRTRSSSASSTYSSRSSSSDTSLCDDNAKDSDSEQDLVFDSNTNKSITSSTGTSQLPVREPAVGSLSPVVSNNNRDKSDEGISSLNDSVIRTTGASPTILVREPAISSYYKKSNLDQECEELLSSLNKNVIKVTSSPATSFKESYLSSSPPVTTTSINQSTGEELRTYFSGFQEKDVICDSLLKQNETRYTFSTPRTEDNYLSSDYKKLDQNEPLDDLNMQFSSKPWQPSSPSKSSIRVTDLSPIDLSPCNFGLGYLSPLEYNYEANYSDSYQKKVERPSDIIDTLTMYPNFVPDIDLSDRDFITVTRSPGAESLVVSEDETPIPLKIDEYFEDSPEFFGARITVTDPKNTDIASRRPHKRQYRPPKKPDSLNLQYSHNSKLNSTEESERASSLPKSLSISNTMDELALKDDNSKIINEQSDAYESMESDASNILYNVDDISNKTETNTSKDLVNQSGRKNSERALEIIQENSKILSRILTKQSISDTKRKISPEIKLSELTFQTKSGYGNLASPLLRESTSDSLLGQKVNQKTEGKETTLPKTRPVSIDDSFSFDINKYLKQDNQLNETQALPRAESLENRTDHYGWENKGFIAKCNFKSHIDESMTTSNIENSADESLRTNQCPISPEWRYSEESNTSLTLPLTDFKDSLNEQKFSQDSLEFNISTSRRFNDSDYKLHESTKTSDCKQRMSENVINSQASDFSNVVTSSISFTYERSAEDDSPIGAKTNSSDTLCQITSLDQVSTPISPKLFSKDTPTMPKDYMEKGDKLRYESDDTCSAITSLIETDTLSSLSYPRSPSTGSYHPFPTRPALRMPKELGVRLGMYPKDTNSSPK